MTEKRHRSSSKAHLGEKCYLCGVEPLTVYSKPSGWPDETQRWIAKLCGKSIPPKSVVCRACEKYIKRNTGKSDVTPRWVSKNKAPTCSYRIVEGCGDVSHTTTSIVSYEVAQEYLDLLGTSDGDNTISRPLCLCKLSLPVLVQRSPLSTAMCSLLPAKPTAMCEIQHRNIYPAT